MTITDIARLRVEVSHLQAAIDDPDAATPDYIVRAEDRYWWRCAWFKSTIKAAIDGINHAIEFSDDKPPIKRIDE